MQLSAKKQRDLTFLEIQAQQIVNEDEDAPEVTDQEKYEALIAKRQERRAVSCLFDGVMVIMRFGSSGCFIIIIYRVNHCMTSWKDK